MAPLPERNATNTYLLDKPFASALKCVRTALEKAHLTIAAELDLAARIRKALRIGVPPCVVLFTSFSDWTEDAPNAATGALIPVHIVVSARGMRTEVHTLRGLPKLDASLQCPRLARLARLQTSIARVLEGIGMRRLDA